MSLDSLKDVYLDQMQDLYSACSQSAEIVPDLGGAAKHDALKSALTDGERGIREGMTTLKGLIEAHGADPDGEHCKGMEGLVAEAKAHGLEESFGDEDAQDAMIVTQYQRMTHYAIAGYGCCVAFAKRLGLSDDAEALQTCLDACYDGDRRFTQIAEGGINAAAA